MLNVLRKIIVVNCSIGVIAWLLMVALDPSGHGHVLSQLGRALSISFFIGTPIAVVFERFGARMYGRRFPVNWALVLMTILACSFAGYLAYNSFAVALGFVPPREFWNSFWSRAQFAVILSVCFGVAIFTYRLLRRKLEHTTLQLRNKQLEEERARKLAVEAQLASLESHVRPHFLFNTLNTISSLIPEDPRLAESLVGKLATLLRFSLDSNQERITSLERELKVVTDYLEIERARFGGRLRFRIDVPSELRSAAVPALSLQTLVENSVKFAVGIRSDGAEIHITAFPRDGFMHVEVSDNGPGFAAQAIRPGHGLDNLQGRLTALFGSAAKLDISKKGEFTAVAFCLPQTDVKTGKFHAASVSDR